MGEDTSLRFSVATQQHVSGGAGVISSSPFDQVIMRMLNRKADVPNAIDAVIVIQETNEIAEGKLSPNAQKNAGYLAGSVVNFTSKQ